MAQIIISLGATGKNISATNKNEAKNYIREIKQPALIISQDPIYKKDPDFTFLSYQLIENLKLPNLIVVDPVSNPTNQVLKSVLSKLKEGLIIIDMSYYIEQFDDIISIINSNTNNKINVLLNIPDVKLCKDNLHKIHTGWRMFNSIKKSDFEWLKDNIGQLDAVGLLITGALRDEYVKTYKIWIKKEKKKAENNIINIPFYYNNSLIQINEEVFNELINPVIDKLKLFEIKYNSNDIKEMYL